MYIVSEFKVVTELRMSLVFQFTFHSITEYIDNIILVRKEKNS